MANFFINETLKPLVSDPELLLVYPHSQRTGGVTMRRRVLAEVYGEGSVYNRHYTNDPKKWRNLTDDDLRGKRAFTDLCDYKDIGLQRPLLFIATIRHPLYRAASLYFWIKEKKNGHRHQELARRSNIEDFYRTASADHPLYFRNVQTKRICGEADASVALDLVREKYIGVGLTNYLSEFVPALCSVFGWPQLDIESRGLDPERYDSAVTDGFKNAVLEENAEDMKLFDGMLEMCASTNQSSTLDAGSNRLDAAC